MIDHIVHAVERYNARRHERRMSVSYCLRRTWLDNPQADLVVDALECEFFVSQESTTWERWEAILRQILMNEPLDSQTMEFVFSQIEEAENSDQEILKHLPERLRGGDPHKSTERHVIEALQMGTKADTEIRRAICIASRLAYHPSFLTIREGDAPEGSPLAEKILSAFKSASDLLASTAPCSDELYATNVKKRYDELLAESLQPRARVASAPVASEY